MATASNEVSTKGEVDTKQSRRSRRNWSEAYKRQVVAETLEPGSSVSIVARRHDVNANQLFKWRRELRPQATGAVIETGQLVPVTIQPEPEPARRSRRRRAELAGFIEIELGSGARVVVRGEVCNDNCDVRSTTIRLAGLVIADGGRHGPTTISDDD